MSSHIILASSSPFRKLLLEKIVNSFSTFSPNINETARANETPEALVLRLSQQKAQASEHYFQSGWAIGSDQVAVFNNQILGKPHTVANAIEQLSKFSGQTVTFLTGVALYDIKTKKSASSLERFTVHFKTLTQQQIIAYINKEQPLNCAGSFKSEGLGVTLFDKLEGDDPNSLIGLPLITLNKLFLDWGFDVLTDQE